MTTEDFPITSFVHACPLCQAAKDSGPQSDDDLLKQAASKHGVTVQLLKRRLGLITGRRTWDEREIAAFTDDVNEGKTYDELAAKWQLSKSRVGQLITKFEIDTGPGRRERSRRDAVRFGEVAEAVIYCYDLEPNLTIEANFEWSDKMGLVSDLTLEAVQDVYNRIGLEAGDLDAMPPDATAGVEVVYERAEMKPVRPVEDHQLPEPKVKDDDDVVEVPQRSKAEWLKVWLSEDPEGTIEDYKLWAKDHDGAPDTKEIREEYGSWRSAKAAALA